VFDECHHVVADTWARIAAAYSASHLLGMTATPQRSDGSPLGDVFDSIVVGATVAQLTALGHLVPCRIWAPPGVLDAAELATTPLQAYQQHGEGDRAVIFCATVDHAERTAEEFIAAGVPAEAVHGKLGADERKQRLGRLASGQTRVICNVFVLTEGWDLPAVAVCVLARKPQFAGTYLQMVGRVLRPAPGKSTATLLDLCGSSLAHGPPEMDRTYTLDGKGIAAVKREPIRQCPHCGGVFMQTADGMCPQCGMKLPFKKVKAPESVGVGLVESKGAVDQLLLNLRAAARRHSDGWVERAHQAIGGRR